MKRWHKEKEVAWAKLCIERGEILFEKMSKWEDIYWEDNWEFMYFAKGFDKKVAFCFPNGKINTESDAWVRWKVTVVWEGWLTSMQKGLVKEQEFLHANRKDSK